MRRMRLGRKIWKLRLSMLSSGLWSMLNSIRSTRICRQGSSHGLNFWKTPRTKHLSSKNVSRNSSSSETMSRMCLTPSPSSFRATLAANFKSCSSCTSKKRRKQFQKRSSHLRGRSPPQSKTNLQPPKKTPPSKPSLLTTQAIICWSKTFKAKKSGSKSLNMQAKRTSFLKTWKTAPSSCHSLSNAFTWSRSRIVKSMWVRTAVPHLSIFWSVRRCLSNRTRLGFTTQSKLSFT